MARNLRRRLHGLFQCMTVYHIVGGIPEAGLDVDDDGDKQA
jgi:hypothetical protein